MWLSSWLECKDIRTWSNVCPLLQGPGSHPLPTHRPWPLPHPWAQIPVVTNRPEITAETVKPTTTVSGTTGNSRSTLSNPHLSHHHQNHHVDGRTQTRDQLFLSRLRNRYRQVWWGVVLCVCSMCIYNIHNMLLKYTKSNGKIKYTNKIENGPRINYKFMSKLRCLAVGLCVILTSTLQASKPQV